MTARFTKTCGQIPNVWCNLLILVCLGTLKSCCIGEILVVYLKIKQVAVTTVITILQCHSLCRDGVNARIT